MILEQIEELIDEAEIDSLGINIEESDLAILTETDEYLYEGLSEAFESAGFENADELASNFQQADESVGATVAGAAKSAGGAVAAGATAAAAATGKGLVGAANAAGIKGTGVVSAVGGTTNLGAIALGGGAIVALAGAYALAKYLGSIGRLNKVIQKYKALVAQAKDPAKKSKLAAKLKSYEERLKKAQAKARVKKGSFIEKTKQMKSQLAGMKSSDPKHAKLKKKLDARQKVISKIGAKI